MKPSVKASGDREMPNCRSARWTKPLASGILLGSVRDLRPCTGPPWRLEGCMGSAVRSRLGCVLLVIASSACSGSSPTTQPSSVSVTSVDATTRTLPVTTTIVEPSTSVPFKSVTVGAEMGLPLDRTVLWEGGAGEGSDQLGLSSECSSDCGAWSPISVGATVVILDQPNLRWVSVRGDHSTVVDALGFGSVPAGQPLLAPDGLIYVPFRLNDAAGSTVNSTWVVRGYEPNQLASPAAEIPINGSMYTIIEVDGDQLLANGRSIRQLSRAASAKVTIEGNRVTVSTGTSRTVWTLPDRWTPNQPRVLSDGSVVVRGTDGKITVLKPDGTWATVTMSGINTANNGEITVDDNGVVQLEFTNGKWQVVRYSLPNG